MLPVSYDDVLEAVPRVRGVLRPTPLYEWPGLSRLLGCRFLLKHENHQPTGAFKVRGGINLVGTLTDQEREAGVLACSTGNHGQSLAFACRHFGVKCTIVVPRGNNPDKNRAIRDLGAKLIEHGRDFDEAREHLESVLAPEGGRYVHSANEPQLIAGVATMAVEIFEDFEGVGRLLGEARLFRKSRASGPLPKRDSRPRSPDVILVPIGLGSGVCGTSIVAKRLHPETQVVGVQSEAAPAVVETWRTGRPCETKEAATWAEGMATRKSAELTMKIMRELMDDAILVGEDDLRSACHTLLKYTHNLAEGAGAAPLAAAWNHRERFAGKAVVALLSGGNLDLSELPAVLAAPVHGTP